MPVRVPPRAAPRQRAVGQRFETQARYPLRRGVDRDLVRREHRVRARRQERVVGERGQRHAVRGVRVRGRERDPGTLGRSQRLLPPFLRGAKLRRDRLELLLEPVDDGLRALARRFLLRGREIEPGLEEPRAVAKRTALVVRVGKEGEQPEVVLLAEGIVLVVVALGAADGAAEPHGGGRVHAIHERFVHRLVGIDTAFFVRHRVAVEAGRDFLILGPLLVAALWQHVAGDLLDRELVERQIAVERVDHPVAILPDAAPVVLLVAVRVGVAGEIQPRTRPPLAVARRGQQAIDDAVVGVRRRVGEEGVELGGRRRKAGQVERDATEERRLRCVRRWRELFTFEPRQHEPVDGRARPGRAPDGRELRPRRLHVRPVFGVGRRARCAAELAAVSAAPGISAP